MAHDVFISYSTKDKTIANAVCAKLEENRIRVWIAPRDVPAGANFAESIVDAIDTCKVFVLIWSADANTSKHILNEINQAFDQGIIIIPFRIQDVQPTSAMRYYIGNTHWLDAIDPPLENHIATLMDNILVNLGRDPKPSLPAQQLEEAPEEVVKPPDEPREKKEPVIERSEAVKTPPLSPRQKIDKEIKPAGAAPPNWTRFIPYAAGGLVVLALIVLLVSGVFKGPTPAEIIQPSLSPTETVSPTSTSRPTETATPIPDWVNEISEPILSVIKDRSPDFEDDFSQVDPVWNYDTRMVGTDELCFNTDGATMSINDGSMKCSLDANCRQGILSHRDMDYDNYVLQTDINFKQTGGTIEFRMFYPEESALSFFLKTYGEWIFEVIEHNEALESIEARTDFNPSVPATITIINKCPAILIYLNSSLLVSRNDIELCYEPVRVDFNMFNEGHITEIETFELDNVKIWDLDNFE
jgi:hypothetical protein